ncbi:enoyl-CoA hydratase/isomerase family protein [Paralimibaculum aggregatum]|uniref:Enoyl-CoA hydratase/isomerase family protein n=1 Tax=Paralimibaculum aggregatum TaxID=3036245 RepID=A0ABQ6LLM8_9RHOB|nr:enoyl-CoA hydratase/isomerase family protein [Limibaculum sp. NKW23]
MSEDLIYSEDGAIARVVFNRPESRNALTLAMYDGLARICREIPADGPVKALIVGGAGGRAFAAGTDMTEFRAFEGEADALGYERRMDAVLGDIERCAVPTIAAITGACTGGGAAISAACDIRITDARLKWGFPIARTLGNCLSIANLGRLADLVGPGRLREILFTARLIGAEEAERIGLVSEVLADPEAVAARATALAGQLASHAPLTLRATKEGLRRLRTDGPRAEGDDLILLTYLSADFREGMEAFLGKRQPEWQGK